MIYFLVNCSLFFIISINYKTYNSFKFSNENILFGRRSRFLQYKFLLINLKKKKKKKKNE